MTHQVTKRTCFSMMQGLQKYRQLSTCTTALARHLSFGQNLYSSAVKTNTQVRPSVVSNRFLIPNSNPNCLTLSRSIVSRNHSNLKSRENVANKTDIDVKRTGRFDFDEEEDLRQLLEDVRNLFKTDGFKLSGLPHQAEEESELLAKYLCLCQCSPANILQMLKENPQIFKTPWTSLQKVIFILEEIGLKRGQLLKALSSHTLLWESDEAALRKRLSQLRHLGFNEDLRKTVAKWSQILTVPNKQINSVVETLKSCDFSRSETCVIIGDHPQMLSDSPEEIALKFQYVHFCMGITEGKELVNGKIFKYSLDHIRTRHILMDRMGLYHTPDKHKIRSANNPHLQMIIDSTNSRFCRKVLKPELSEEDYELFKDNLKEELKGSGGDEVEYHSEEEDSNYDSSDEDESRSEEDSNYDSSDEEESRRYQSDEDSNYDSSDDDESRPKYRR